ncbi:hypothetical protein LUZ61_019175 [Rhynchospora tenuis]|uniref:Disease resistance protein RGA3 n=1 Tax=Rhynchospora tenuis TaxID=198213 RepID=A0AAD5ZAM5_9POAL|nr:hypothetical protein LUZ61_019175 [Rhynchospora tenuis]
MPLDMFLSPLISVAVKKAADSLTEQICRMWGMTENLEKLHRHLLAVREKIEEAEERGGDSLAVREWLKELEAAACKAVDVLDEFQYEALRQNAISQGASPEVIKGFFSHQNPAVFRYQMTKKLTKILAKIDEIVTEMNKFNLSTRAPATPSIDRETQSFVMASEVIGRYGENENIISKLLDPQRERDNISVLAIVGMGGMGKTTLAQLVFNDKRVKKHFKLLMWVCVSTEFNVVNIIKSIIQVATNNKGDVSTSNKEVLRRQLYEILDRKRYLLMLDDVWNEEREKWNELRTLLFSRAFSGSVIIVTTRSQDVASIMQTLPSHKLAELTIEDSWRLFEKTAFGSWVEEPLEEHLTIGRTIVHKCGGLPLALKAIGGLMETKREVRDWHSISESNLWDGYENVQPLEEDEEEEEEENQINYQTGSLRKLSIEESNFFFTCGPTKVVALGFRKYFAVLESLEIRDCDAFVFLSEEELRSLKFLKLLKICWCKNLRSLLQAAAVSSSTPAIPREEHNFLPHLESLCIAHCPELVQVPAVSSNSLQCMWINNCPKLSREEVSHLTTNLTELKLLSITEFTNWRTWPDNMEHLPSLEFLHVDNCPGIKSFPEGLLQRLASLDSLDIFNCPALERRCRSGGDYCHLVSSNSYTDSEENIAKWRRISRRLLFCQRSN